MFKLVLLLGLFLPVLTLQTFNVLGTVRGNAGQPVGSIRISLMDENNQPLRTVFTDSSGRFKFAGLRSGRYMIRVEPLGTAFEEQTIQLDLQAIRIRGAGSEPFPVDIVLKPRHEGAGTDGARVLFVQEVPDAARVEYERGANDLKQDKPERAMASLKKAIEIFPDYFLALELLGTEYVKRGEYDPAIPVLTRAVELNRTAHKSMYALGVACLKLNRFTEAIEWLRKTSQLDPNNANAFIMLGIAYGNNRQLDEAEAMLRKAYQIGKSLAADAHLYLAGLYNNQERYAEAVQELELYLKEAKEIKNSAPIKDMIKRLKEKQKAKK